MNHTSPQLPKRLQVTEVISSRYLPGERPTSWDERSSGLEKVRTADGEIIELYSGGGQSSPAPGWELLLMRESAQSSGAYEWTLYGVSVA